MSAKRFWISTGWLAIGGLIWAAILWLPVQIPSWVWLIALVAVIILFGLLVPNWWAEASGPIYLVVAWVVGGIITRAWAMIGVSVNQWWNGHLSWYLLWLLAAAILAFIGFLLARCYLSLEYLFNRDEFCGWVEMRDILESQITKDLLVWTMGLAIYGVWFLLLLQPTYSTAQTIDRVLYSLLFAWISVWLGKLDATLTAIENPDILARKYEEALIKGKRWSEVRSERQK